MDNRTLLCWNTDKGFLDTWRVNDDGMRRIRRVPLVVDAAGGTPQTAPEPS